jgi:hypothetical protein
MFIKSFNNQQYIYLFFIINIILVIFYIYFKSTYIKLVYKKQRLEYSKVMLNDNLTRLKYEFLVLKDRDMLVNYAINSLNMVPISISSIKDNNEYRKEK